MHMAIIRQATHQDVSCKERLSDIIHLIPQLGHVTITAFTVFVKVRQSARL
jgi:hypothetical protein